MPCSDSSSSVLIKLDHEERFISFEYAKITCGREIQGDTGLNKYFKGRTLPEILAIPFADISQELKIQEEEAQFILYLEWDALRSALAQYLGFDDPQIDRERCFISSISATDEGIEVAEVILPPKEIPKILPCSLASRKDPY